MFEVCTRCLMPSTRPETPLVEGVCRACKNFDTRNKINWAKRLNELKNICDSHKSKSGMWDCVLPVSGGKDSHAMVYWIKEVMGMNPLLVTVGDPFTKTQAGLRNYQNLSKTFGCDHFLFTVSEDLARRLIQVGFEKFLDPLRFIEQILNTIPFKLAIKFGIRLSFKGESPFVYGASTIENKSALERMHKKINDFDVNFWTRHGADIKELNSIMPPAKAELENLNPEVYFLSYFVPWSSISNLKIAKRYGFTDLAHEWGREGYIENFEQIDSIAYLVHIWLKYPKFGFQRISDIVSRRIREGLLLKDKGKRLIAEGDPQLDQKALEDFVNFLGYTKKEFWDIVENFWNKEIFEKKGISWEMKISRFPK